MKYLEFKNKEYSEFKHEIFMRSRDLFKKILLENCPIQVGDEVISTNSFDGEHTRLQVTDIKLCAISSWGEPGEILSFEFWGIPLTKKGQPCKNRNPVWFSHFFFKGQEYDCPSYSRFYLSYVKMSSKKTS